MRKVILSVLFLCAVLTSCSSENGNDIDSTSISKNEIELSMTDYNRIFLWVSTCISDDDTYGNYIPLRETHPDWYATFHNGDADFGLLMEIGRYYYFQDIYGDTTGEGDWQNEEKIMLHYFGLTD